MRVLSTAAAVQDGKMRIIPSLLARKRCLKRLGDRSASQRRDDLRPDRNHAQKQRQRGERGGFFDKGANHDHYSHRQEQVMNIVHAMFVVKWR